MTIDGTAETARRWWRTRKSRVIGFAAAAVVIAFVVGYALIPQPETFRTAPELMARLGELGAPCLDYKPLSDDETYGLCHADGHSFVALTDPKKAEQHVAGWRARPYDLDGDAVAAGEGWYLYGDPAYVSHVAKLLDAELIS